MATPVLALTCLGKIGGSVLGKIGEYLVAPIGRQFTYMCCFNSNIMELETQLQELETTRQGVQMGVDDTRRKVRVVGPTVEAWLTKANEVTRDVEGIIEDKAKVNKGCLNGWCPNLKLRYSLSKKAVEKTKVVVDLQAAGVQYTKSSYSPPPACTETIPNRDFTMFESRRLNMEEIIEALKHDEINLIGICGLPGVGKTKMVQEVRKRGKEEKLFDEVAFVVVGQYPDLTKFQKCIANIFGVADIGKHDDASTRAGLLHKRLLQDNKKILVILDDVWEDFDLEDVGIPLEGANNNFKILYTSRTRDLWHDVQTKKEIHLEILSEDEAWQLFREKVGDSADAPNLQTIGKQIMNECGCLPLALVIIGSTLSKKSGGSSTKDIWEEMLDRLTCPGGTPADKRLFSSLEQSYNYVEDEEAKHLFLLCCLFEEDRNICIEDLARYGLGLSLFDGIYEMRKVRCRVFALIDDLKSRYLILDTETEEYVKLHDVVRDMGISIASRDKNALVSHGNISEWRKENTYKDYTSISVISRKITGFPKGLRCPSLMLLLLQCGNLDEMPCNFFDGVEELKVLVLKGYSQWHSKSLRNCSLPLQSLRSLRTLSLEDFNVVLENASAIGDLRNLEILKFGGHEELPKEIGELAKLRLLDLTCGYLRRIPSGVISRLSSLEELYIIGCRFTDWEGEGKEEGVNASLREFESLSNLNTLEIRITDAMLLPKIPIFSNLTKFWVEIGNQFGHHFNVQRADRLYVSSLTPIHSDCGGLNLLLRRTEYLALLDEGSSDLVKELFVEGVTGLQILKYLLIAKCASPECLANTINLSPQSNATAPAVFPMLESLSLFGLPNLREICHGPVPANSFGKLTSLNIRGCGTMEEVIRKDQGEDTKMGTSTIEFPKLESMKLVYLPSLVSFCRGIDKVDFPELKHLYVVDIPQLKGLFHTNTYLSSDIEDSRNVGYHSLFPLEVSLPNLERLELFFLKNLETLGHSPLSVGSLSKLKQISVYLCNKLLCVFPSQLHLMLRELEQVTVENCDLLEIVYEFEGVDSNETNTEILSPLENFTLSILPKLKYISKRDPVGFKYIQTLNISDCNSLRYVFAPTMMKSIPQLRQLKISRCEVLSRIVAEENGLGESSVHEVEFPQLAWLELRDLPNLVSFFPEVTTTPATSTDHYHNTLQPQPLFNGKVALPNLKYLGLFSLQNLETLGNQISVGSLSKLKRIFVHHCDKLFCGFSSQLHPMLQDLENLSVESCNLLEVVYELEIVDYDIPNAQILSPLKFVRCLNLPNLNYISKRDPLGFKYIQTIHIYDCNSLRCVFAPTMMKSIPQLRELTISRCEVLSRIVAEENGLGECSVNEVEFPKLESLHLNNLPDLVSFFPKVTTTSATSTDHYHNPLQPQPLFNEKVAVPSLKYLQLRSLKNFSDLWSSELPMSSFSELKELEVIDCQNLRNTFHPSMVGGLAKLKKLVITNCSKMEAVVDYEEEGQGRKIDRTMFPQLREMKLYSLPNLSRFCHFTHPLELPLLSEMDMLNCPSMDAFSSGHVSTPKLYLPGTSWKDDINRPRRLSEVEHEREKKRMRKARVYMLMATTSIGKAKTRMKKIKRIKRNCKNKEKTMSC